ncbi:hypothetical protein BT96DRAFT_822250, partial [Gymnopus androsaceus JB14]
NSLTKLLPAWNKTVADLNLCPKCLPHNIRTRWNSIFDMINIALEYKTALTSFISNPDNGLT